MKHKKIIAVLTVTAVLTAAGILAGCGRGADEDTLTLTNVSYDPTRELYKEYNEAFKNIIRSRPVRISASSNLTAVREAKPGRSSKAVGPTS